MDHAVHVALAHARDLLPVVGVERALPSHASVVHQDGDGPQLRFGAHDHGFDGGGLGDVCCHRDSSSAGGHNLSSHHPGRIGMRRIVHAYGDATSREEPRRCSADATGAARHYRYLLAPYHQAALFSRRISVSCRTGQVWLPRHTAELLSSTALGAGPFLLGSTGTKCSCNRRVPCSAIIYLRSSLGPDLSSGPLLLMRRVPPIAGHAKGGFAPCRQPRASSCRA